METTGRRWISTLILAATLAGLGTIPVRAASAKSPVKPTVETIRLLAGEPGTVEQALAKLLSTHLKRAAVRIRTALTGHERLLLLNAGEGDLAVVAAHVLAAAHDGKAEFSFKSKLSELRAVAGLHSELMYLIAAKDAGITKLSDLKGKRVSVGPPRSDTELATRAILAAAGVRPEDFSTAEYLPFADAAELIKKKQLDAFFHLGPAPDPELKALVGSAEIMLVEIPPEIARKLGAPASIPANSYSGQNKPVATAQVPYWLVTRADVSAAAIHDLTKALFDRRKKAVPAIRDAARHAPVPLHPGAAKYYREGRR
jgi:TRAP transporter TAXI family solute receptor